MAGVSDSPFHSDYVKVIFWCRDQRCYQTRIAIGCEIYVLYKHDLKMVCGSIACTYEYAKGKARNRAGESAYRRDQGSRGERSDVLDGIAVNRMDRRVTSLQISLERDWCARAVRRGPESYETQVIRKGAFEKCSSLGLYARLIRLNSKLRA